MEKNLETNTIRTYTLRLDLDTNTTDRMERNTFIMAMRAEMERIRKEMMEVLTREYDERIAAADTNPVKPDTVVS